MTDDQIRAELGALGIDEQAIGLVMLLPLVHVAWADGRVQDEEQVVIMEVARERLGLGYGALAVLRRWLARAPDAAVIERGQKLLAALALRRPPIAAALPEDAADAVVVLCEQVARAAGGLLGVLWTVDDRERAAIDAVARAMTQERLQLLAELPSPGAGWEDLPTEA